MQSNKTFYKLVFFNVLIKFMAIISGLLVNRWLNLTDSKSYADFNIAFAYVSLVMPFIYFGIPTLINKSFLIDSEGDKGDTFINLSILRLFSFSVGILLILLTFQYTKLDNFNLVLGLYLVQFIIFGDIVFKSIGDAVGNIWKFSLTDFASKTMQVIILYTSFKLLNIQPNVSMYILVAIFCSSISLIMDYLLFKQYIPNGKFNYDLLKQKIPGVLYLSLSALVVGLFLTTDKLLLRYFNFSDSEINGYSNIYKLFEVAGVTPAIILPSIVGRMINKKILIRSKEFYNYLFFVTLTGLIYSIVFYFIAKPAISLIDPELKYYQNSIIAIPYLAISLVFIFILQFLGQFNVIIGKEKYDLIASVSSTIVALTAYFILIPPFGILGAAISTLIAFSFDSFIKMIVLLFFVVRTEN
jgi:O-antigen/teichoic acid export membrane protein